MVRLCIFLLAIVGSKAFGDHFGEITECKLNITRPTGKTFNMNGVIINNAIPENNAATYLTLEPPILTGFDVELRVLYTIWDYHPVNLHPRGNTARVVASSEIEAGHANLHYTDEKGNQYHVICSPLE